MTTQPNPSTPQQSVSTAAAVCLSVATFAAAGLATVVLVDVATPIEPSRGITGLLAAVCSVFGIAYISRSAEDRICRREATSVALILDRIEQLEERMDEHAANLTEQGEQTYASAFVAGAAGGRAHLSAVPRG